MSISVENPTSYLSEHGLCLVDVKLSCSQPLQEVLISVVRFVRDVLDSSLELLQSSLLLWTQVTHIPTHYLKIGEGGS